MLTKEDRLVIAVKNAEAIAQTLVEHGERFQELYELVDKQAVQIQNFAIELKLQKDMIVKSLQQKYGTGPTERE